jgi:NADP-dependent 3-hydroxy acid dehydrogenase YdfG
MTRPAVPFPNVFRHVVITGASTGIGAALARIYAAPEIRLSLLARDLKLFPWQVRIAVRAARMLPLPLVDRALACLRINARITDSE